MVKSLRGTIDAAFLSQLRTMTVSEKARRHAEQAVSENRITVAEPVSPSFAKMLKLNGVFFNDFILQVTPHAIDGTVIPSRREILSNILHAKMQRGDYNPVNIRSQVHGFTSPFESIVFSALMILSSTSVAGAGQVLNVSAGASSLHDTSFGSRGHWMVKAADEKIQSENSSTNSCLRLKGVATGVGAKRFKSFSSSPLWYQQGMENGPPQ
jgi:hypothetical protein